jgi:hypothetical protein
VNGLRVGGVNRFDFSSVLGMVHSVAFRFCVWALHSTFAKARCLQALMSLRSAVLIVRPVLGWRCV